DRGSAPDGSSSPGGRAARELRNPPAAGRVRDELFQSLESCLLFLRAQHPPAGGSLVARRLGLEELPGLRVLLQETLVRLDEPGGALLVGIDSDLVLETPREGLEARGPHPFL